MERASFLTPPQASASGVAMGADTGNAGRPMIKLMNVTKAFDSQVVLNNLNLEIPDRQDHGHHRSVRRREKRSFEAHDRPAAAGQRRSAGGWGEILPGWAATALNRVREKFGMLFQNAALFDSMTVFENVAFPLEEKTRLSAAEIARQGARGAGTCGPCRERSRNIPDELSGGMKKRVGLARAVLLDPKIILFDEPTTGLDPIICRATHQLIKDTHATIRIHRGGGFPRDPRDLRYLQPGGNAVPGGDPGSGHPGGDPALDASGGAPVHHRQPRWSDYGSSRERLHLHRGIHETGDAWK